MQETADSGPGDLNAKIRSICLDATAVGREIDLSGCGYGIPHWESTSAFITHPSAYYFFLAGFVRVNNIRTVMEIGTHCGGSIRSMMRGLAANIAPEDATFVTLDIQYLNEEAFVSAPDSYIKRIHSDANAPAALEQAESYFSGRPVDLLYIDSEHTYEATLPHIFHYSRALSPKWLILDDIHLTESMDRLWNFLVTQFGERCCDVTSIMGRGDSGFGVVLLK